MIEHRFSDLRIGMEAEFDRIAVRGALTLLSPLKAWRISAN